MTSVPARTTQTKMFMQEAPLLTLRSELRKSTGTYDKEIEGLKDMLERTRPEYTERQEYTERLTREREAVGRARARRSRARSTCRRIAELLVALAGRVVDGRAADAAQGDARLDRANNVTKM